MKRNVTECLMLLLMATMVLCCFKVAMLHSESLPLENWPLHPAPRCAGVFCVEVK